jgi:type 2A phosphatase activator TIP41
MPVTVPTKPYDWTYTTTYAGSPSSPFVDLSTPNTSSISWIPADPQQSSHSIPLAELTRPDPILFYAEIPLFEDELHDNGSSCLIVRIVSMFYPFPVMFFPLLTVVQRVMPTCIFILSRFTLRVDNVLFRTHDTRIYHSFSSQPPLVVRETSGWEAPYEKVRRVGKRMTAYLDVAHEVDTFSNSQNEMI